jgi:hypothetical protein
MATFLHLVGHNNPGPSAAVIAGQVAAGDVVTVAVVGPSAPTLGPGPTVLRVPEELSWDGLLDLILTTDQTFSW